MACLVRLTYRDLYFDGILSFFFQMRRQADASALLSLPSNATSIRTSIADSFTCAERNYGYYADVDNECQLFHVCLPVEFADGKKATYKWSFICPEETVFNQVRVSLAYKWLIIDIKVL